MEGIANALTHEEAVEKAKELAATLKTRFKLTEEISRQPEETIQELRESGLIHAMVPKRFGGSELDFNTLFRTAIEIAKVDPSAGWCYTLLSCSCMAASLFPRRGSGRSLGKKFRCNDCFIFCTFEK